MGELTVCGATEDGACYFSQQINSLQTDVNRLTAERDALLADRDEWHRVATGQLQTIDQLRAEVEQNCVETEALHREHSGYRDQIADLTGEVERLKERYRVPPAGMTVRAAARERYGLSGASAQALEGALQQADAEVERLKVDSAAFAEEFHKRVGERDEALRQLRELREAASEICEYEPLSDSDHGYVRAWECLQALLAKEGS